MSKNDIEMIREAVDELSRISMKYESNRIPDLQKIIIGKLESVELEFPTTREQLKFEQQKEVVKNIMAKPISSFQYDQQLREPYIELLRTIDFYKKKTGNKVHVFLSYSTKDKILAGKIKNGLEKSNFQGFLAHEDITVSEEWRDRLLKELERCDIFLPIITDNFLESEWTSQEVGLAFSRRQEIIIVPITFNHTPPGFLAAVQGFECNSNEENFEIKIADKIQKLSEKSE